MLPQQMFPCFLTEETLSGNICFRNNVSSFAGALNQIKLHKQRTMGHNYVNNTWIQVDE